MQNLAWHVCIYLNSLYWRKCLRLQRCPPNIYFNFTNYLSVFELINDLHLDETLSIFNLNHLLDETKSIYGMEFDTVSKIDSKARSKMDFLFFSSKYSSLFLIDNLTI